jgi:uncharacterized membrane protein
MSNKKSFFYTPTDFESEKASTSYLMSLIALIAGLPFPIINLLATIIFFLFNRKSSYFIRWHCTQALLSQFTLLLMNSYGFWWTVSIFWGPEIISNNYIAYIFTIIIFNIFEFAATIYSAIETRKGKHIEWWFYGSITNLICKP